MRLLGRDGWHKQGNDLGQVALVLFFEVVPLDGQAAAGAGVHSAGGIEFDFEQSHFCRGDAFFWHVACFLKSKIKILILFFILSLFLFFFLSLVPPRDPQIRLIFALLILLCFLPG